MIATESAAHTMRTYRDLMQLVEQSPPIEQDDALATKQANDSQVNEADDDPHRLARVNLERYATTSDGEATIRYWREEWYTWKKSRGCYRKIGERELRAKMGLAIKKEFDRLNIDKLQNGDDDEPPLAKKVTRSLLTNVMEATASTQIVPSHTEAGSLLIPGGRAQRKNWIAMRNGILDVDGLLAGDDDVLHPHTPNWFSTVCLPYDFNPEAECPKWDAFMAKNLEGDQERINILQEWAGYLLLPDTGQQRFMILEGEGANGKSVYCAAIEALIGGENCSHVPLELFGDRFSKTSTIGKLANISADAGEMEKTAEGFLKSFTAGETMNFDRKGISAIDCYPTARLMIACNNRPRFSDRSDGIWRRLILIPWRIQIQPHERIPNMDKAWWWEQSGELPGIFLWAIRGLHRLRQQGRFSQSEISKEATADYQEDTNPAKHFLREHLEVTSGGKIQSQSLYEIYTHWAEKSGYKTMSERTFGKEIRRCFPTLERKKGGVRSDRYWYYENISFVTDEIFGKKTNDHQLF